ncbi:Thermonuclease precursor [Oligella urethralis]|uniref:thermonuclease family protein n=1 Tax=Oligella urethralis TaxID=90245 RepID=UPI000DFA1562|nr:thermonuclease family protein [Oligella urethralis]SUA61595.1 Thermonuclease precursor [Oligella urethralis]
MKRIFLILCLIVLPIESMADTFIGRVVAVLDGDTIEVLDDNKKLNRVRLIEIDAPEKNQAFGTASKRYLSSLVYKKEVIVDWQNKDRYDRLLATIRINKLNINLKMVSDGYAWAYDRYTIDTIYKQAQRQAQAKRLGLWCDNQPIPPWEFRRK